MKDKAMTYMGFARKAGVLVFGTRACMDSMEKGRARLVIFTGDMAENSKKKIGKVAEKTGTKTVTFGTGEELSQITGTAGRNVFAVNDVHFADIILQEIDAGTQ